MPNTPYEALQQVIARAADFHPEENHLVAYCDSGSNMPSIMISRDRIEFMSDQGKYIVFAISEFARF